MINVKFVSFSQSFYVKNTHNLKYTILTILSVRFCV